MPSFKLTTDVTDLVYRFLSDDGTDTGTKNMNGNHSVTPQDYWFECTNPQGIVVERAIFHLEDTNGMAWEEYGNLGGPLTNGYKIQVKDSAGAVLKDLCDGELIKTNADIGHFCFDVAIRSSVGAGNDVCQARWTFGKAGQPVYLRPGDKLVVTLNDDFSGLVDHFIMLHGFWLYDLQH